MSIPPIDLGKVLWNDSLPQNGYQSADQYRDHILEQYKLYLEMADRISSRRDIANGFFLTLNGLILGTVGVLVDKGCALNLKWGLLLPLSVLLIECFFWWRLIISYKQLNGAKFQIIGELESRLPASPYGRAEWAGLLKQGTDKKVYWPLTHLESKIPLIFGVSYLIATIFLWCAK